MIEHLLRNWLRKHRVKANDRRREAEARAELIAARKAYAAAAEAVKTADRRNDDRDYGRALMELMRARNAELRAELLVGR